MADESAVVQLTFDATGAKKGADGFHWTEIGRDNRALSGPNFCLETRIMIRRHRYQFEIRVMSATEVTLTWTLCRTQVSSRR
jgi:hypothetical protein